MDDLVDVMRECLDDLADARAKEDLRGMAVSMYLLHQTEDQLRTEVYRQLRGAALLESVGTQEGANNE